MSVQKVQTKVYLTPEARTALKKQAADAQLSASRYVEELIFYHEEAPLALHRRKKGVDTD